MNYATLYQARQYLGLSATETGDDTKLETFAQQSSRSIERYCRRRFDVRYETRLLDYPIAARSAFGVYSAEMFVAQMNAAGDLGQGRLKVDDDLLSVSELLNGEETEVVASDYVLEPANVYPKHSIRLKSGSGLYWLPDSDGNREQVISVTGLWGYHDRYSDAWVNSLDTVQNNPLTAIATSLTVSDGDGLAGDGAANRFQAGQLIQIESEFLEVSYVSSNTLTVVRGANGSTAAAHAQGTAISIYRPMPDVVLAATRLIAWRYRQKDANSFNRETILETGVYIAPTAMPPDVVSLLPRPRMML